jgi:replicative DNA helicase
MVKLNDKDDRITNDIIKMLLKTDMSKYEREWLTPKFNAWKVSNQVRNNVMKSIDYVRSIEELNYDNVTDVLGKMRSLFNDIQYLDESDDLGADFDDVESHTVTAIDKKIATGWSTLDNVLGGGWNHASMNLIMGEVSIGKCTIGSTLIKIRNKTTGIIEQISYEDFYKKVKLS